MVAATNIATKLDWPLSNTMVSRSRKEPSEGLKNWMVQFVIQGLFKGEGLISAQNNFLVELNPLLSKGLGLLKVA